MAEDTPKAKTGGGLKVALGLSLALNLLVAGAVVGSFLRGGPGGGPEAVRDLGFGPFAGAMRPEDREAMRRAFMDRAPDLREARRAMRAQAEAILSALRAEPYDPAAFEAALARGAERTAERLALGREILAAHVAAMAPADRRAFADRLADSWRRGRVQP